MKLRAKRGRNQKGLCFVSSDTLDPSIETCELTCGFNSVYTDVRGSDKVPDGIIILDTRIFDMLECDDENETNLTALSGRLPICTEIHLDVLSKRDLQNHTVAQAISKRIDDFQEHFEGLVLHQGQVFTVSELGVSFLVRSLSPTDATTNAARIVWKHLLKIHLGALEPQPSNLCIIAEVAAATQIADVRAGDEDYSTRHQAILLALEILEGKFHGHVEDVQFAGFVFSDEVLPFITFDSQTGDEAEFTSLHSSSLIGAFRKWIDTALDDFSKRPSNPGAALKHGLERAQSLSESNGLPTTIVFFSSGVHSAGQNPVKVIRSNIGDQSVRVLSISVGENSAIDIMEAIAKEGHGITFHADSIDRMNLIIETINETATGSG